MMRTFAAKAAHTVSRATLGLALGAFGISVALAQEAGDDGNGGENIKLPNMVVGASRQELQDALSPGVVSVVYPDDVKGEHKSLPEMLDQIPGVYVRRVAGTGQYTTASIRGSAPSQVNIYIDGVPFNLASETAADLSTIPISNVERIEVYRGTTPARFSGAPLGGAINIVTKKPEGLGGSAEIGARSFVGRQGGVSATAPLGNGSLLVGMNHDRSKGNFKYDNFPISATQGLHVVDVISYPSGGPLVNPSDLPVERTRRSNSYDKDDVLVKWQDDAFYAKWAYTYMDRYLPQSAYSGGYSYVNNTSDTDGYCVASDPAHGIVGGCMSSRQNTTRQKQGQHDAVVGWNDTFDDLTLGLNLSMMNKSARFEATDPPGTFFVGQEWTKNHTRRYGIAGDASYQLGDGWVIDQLLEIHGDFYRETYHTDMSGNWTGSPFLDTFRRHKTNIQGQNTLTLNFLDGLQITPLGRLERLQGPTLGAQRYSYAGGADGSYGWKPSGSISAKKNIGEGWQVFGNWGTYNRYPNFYEMYGDGIWVQPNIVDSGAEATVQQLARETGRNADIGFGWDGDLGYTLLGKDLNGGFRATYFERKTKNEITLYSTPVGAKYVNSGDTYTHGGELEGYLMWGKLADLQFAVTRQEGWYQNDGYRYYGGSTPAQRYPGLNNRTLGNPDLAANLRLNLHWLDGDLVTYYELKHTGRVFRGVSQFERSLTTFDTGAHYKIADGVKLSLGVIDLFNQGPKQTYYNQDQSAMLNSRVGQDCTGHPWGEALCQAWGLGTDVYERSPITYNVPFPQQGRTLYATLGWSF